MLAYIPAPWIRHGLCYDFMFVYVGPFQSLFTDLPFGKRVNLEKRTGLGTWFCEWKWQSDGEMSAGCWKMQHHDKGQLRVSVLTSWSLIIIYYNYSFHWLLSHWLQDMNRWLIIPHQQNASLSLQSLSQTPETWKLELFSCSITLITKNWGFHQWGVNALELNIHGPWMILGLSSEVIRTQSLEGQICWPCLQNWGPQHLDHLKLLQPVKQFQQVPKTMVWTAFDSQGFWGQIPLESHPTSKLDMLIIDHVVSKLFELPDSVTTACFISQSSQLCFTLHL